MTSNRIAVFCLVWCLLTVSTNADHGVTVQVGAAKVDITPRTAVHLINEPSPQEMAGVAQQLYARAIAIGSDSPVVLISFDGIGVPAAVTKEVSRRLNAEHAISRERIVICATHTHWAPHLSGLLPTIFGGHLPADQQTRVVEYTNWLIERLAQAASLALGDRSECRLDWASGKVTFASNRRLEEGGRLVTDERLMFTYNPNGLVDHALPVMFASNLDGGLKAILFSYACHNVSLTAREISGFRNEVHGDWAGLAQELIEQRHSDVVAIATIGCGGDQRPSPVGGIEVAEAQAREVADEVDLLLGEPDRRQQLTGEVQTRIRRLTLPLTDLPDRQQLMKFADAGPSSSRNASARAFLAGQMLDRLDRGEPPEPGVPYVVQVWSFPGQLEMVFLAGEVVVDYGIRIRQEGRTTPVWTIAYANETPCYIPSKRLLQRGGYEADTSMHYYGYLRRLTPGTEDLILRAVQQLIDGD